MRRISITEQIVLIPDTVIYNVPTKNGRGQALEKLDPSMRGEPSQWLVTLPKLGAFEFSGTKQQAHDKINLILAKGKKGD